MLISIVIATYNAEKYLERCLNSIIPQLNSECELLVIDGGSSDNTLNIINSKKEYISYVISEKDQGIYDAWNKGIMHSKGEWIMFVGADDILLENALDTYIDYLMNNSVENLDFICAKNRYVNEDGALIKIIGEEPTWNIFKKYMKIAHVGSIHNKKNLFEKIGVFNYKDYKICADYELLLRKKDKLKYAFISKEIASMQIGGVSFSIDGLRETYKIHSDYLNTLQNSICFIRGLLYYFYTTLIWKFFHSSHKRS